MKQIFGILVIIVVLGAGYWFWQSSAQPAADTVQETPSETTQTNQQPAAPTDTGTPSAPAPAAGTFTMAQVATHNSTASCWSVVDGNVYDLTAWIPQHPGGERAIQGMCGKDGTAVFHGQHGDAKKQAEMLATMKIGVLAQ